MQGNFSREYDGFKESCLFIIGSNNEASSLSLLLLKDPPGHSRWLTSGQETQAAGLSSLLSFHFGITPSLNFLRKTPLICTPFPGVPALSLSHLMISYVPKPPKKK